MHEINGPLEGQSTQRSVFPTNLQDPLIRIEQVINNANQKVLSNNAMVADQARFEAAVAYITSNLQMQHPDLLRNLSLSASVIPSSHP